MTAKGDALILAKIRAERRIDADLKEQIEAIFQLLDPFELDVTYAPFEAAFLSIIDRSSEQFFNLESAFLQAYCQVEFGIEAAEAKASYELLGWEARNRISRSLSTVTQGAIKGHTARGDSILKAYADSKTRAVSSGRRHAREPARELTMRTTSRTRGLKGYKRVLTGAETCSFCAMLAGRGAVYDAETVRFRSHDNCDCIGVPATGGPKPTMDQEFLATARPAAKSSELDKEKVAAAIAEWERKRDAGEIELTPLPPRPTYV